ncbi:MAG: adenylate/guanylate cyclase domain-containing protein [Candidatus Electrothrix sp. LOE2]|nr:adenylate/guanylate cyclase domain-containing protein [Candidatus Electrothrix sp. LOE2]
MSFSFREKHGMGAVHLAGLLLTVLSVILYQYNPRGLEELRLRAFDLFLGSRPAPLGDVRVVIVTVDSDSLLRYGQWSWPRDLLAKMLERITAAEPAVVGFDILFAEPDRSSPLMPGHDISLHDAALAKVLHNSPVPVVLGYAFTDTDTDMQSVRKKLVPETGGFVFDGGNPGPFLHTFAGVNSTIKVLEKTASGSGFFNITNSDSITRRIPLLAAFSDQVYPSLILSMIQAAEGDGCAVKVVVDKEIKENGIRVVHTGPYQIPTTMQGELIIHFSGPAHTFPYIAADDILSEDYDPTALRKMLVDAYVLVGISAPGLFDVLSVPTDPVFPGVELHAHALNTILTGNFLHRPEWVKGVEITCLICIGLMFVLLFPRMKATSGALLVLTMFGGMVLFFLWNFSRQILIDIVYPAIFTGLMFTLFTFHNFFKEEQEKHRLRSVFSQYLAPTVVDELLKKRDSLVLDGEERDLTILFSDICKFTAIAEKMSPDNLCVFLNEYLTPMTDAVMERRGTVDKFIGDAVMAFWNAPLEISDHIRSACDCALAMLKELAVLNLSWQQQGMPEIRIGIGIHSGVARVGNMGSRQRFDYTVMGDTVNLASRLEGLTRLYGVDILVSGTIYAAMQESDFCFRYIDTVRVSGKREPVVLYQLLSVRSRTGLTADKREEEKAYNRALALYRAENFQDAAAVFQEMCTKYPAEKLYTVYQERCLRLAAEPPDNWDGVTDMQKK